MAIVQGACVYAEHFWFFLLAIVRLPAEANLRNEKFLAKAFDRLQIVEKT